MVPTDRNSVEASGIYVRHVGNSPGIFRFEHFATANKDRCKTAAKKTSRAGGNVKSRSQQRRSAGDRDKGLGVGSGYEINLPFSKIVSDRWTLHFNAGMSVFPDVRDHDLTNYNLGASAIFAVSRDLNLMLETVAGWNEDIAEGVLSPGTTANRSATALISPGARYAFNLPNDAQVVVGLGLPIGLTSDSPDWGLFFYCSFEHPFMRIEARRTK
jgi:hypothetical protein